MTMMMKRMMLCLCFYTMTGFFCMQVLQLLIFVHTHNCAHIVGTSVSFIIKVFNFMFSLFIHLYFMSLFDGDDAH